MARELSHCRAHALATYCVVEKAEREVTPEGEQRPWLR